MRAYTLSNNGLFEGIPTTASSRGPRIQVAEKFAAVTEQGQFASERDEAGALSEGTVSWRKGNPFISAPGPNSAKKDGQAALLLLAWGRWEKSSHGKLDVVIASKGWALIRVRAGEQIAFSLFMGKDKRASAVVVNRNGELFTVVMKPSYVPAQAPANPPGKSVAKPEQDGPRPDSDDGDSDEPEIEVELEGTDDPPTDATGPDHAASKAGNGHNPKGTKEGPQATS